MKGNAEGSHQVNGISGGTITSVGVQDMIEDCMKSYIPFLKSYEAGKTASLSSENSNPIVSID
jgi:Na+-transporting NADH:ubiquinone oxidoreductase subunit C